MNLDSLVGPQTSYERVHKILKKYFSDELHEQVMREIFDNRVDYYPEINQNFEEFRKLLEQYVSENFKDRMLPMPSSVIKTKNGTAIARAQTFKAKTVARLCTPSEFQALCQELEEFGLLYSVVLTPTIFGPEDFEAVKGILIRGVKKTDLDLLEAIF